MMVEKVSILGLAERLRAEETVFIPGSSGEPVTLTELLARESGLARRVKFVMSFVPGINRHNLAPAGGDRRMRVSFHAPSYAEARGQGSAAVT